MKIKTIKIEIASDDFDNIDMESFIKSVKKQVKKIVKEEMELAVNLKVHLDVDLNVGDSWYETK